MMENTGTRGIVAQQAEVFLQKLFATMSVKMDDLKKEVFPLNDVTRLALESLREEHPPVDSFLRAPNIANFMTMLCESFIGHKIKYIFDPETLALTKLRLNYTGRFSCNKPYIQTPPETHNPLLNMGFQEETQEEDDLDGDDSDLEED